jgi:L-cysteine desulfidase
MLKNITPGMSVKTESLLSPKVTDRQKQAKLLKFRYFGKKFPEEKMSLQCLEEILEFDIKAALGCTEPITIALSTCKARQLLPGKVEKIELRLSTNLLKNAMEVGIPGTGGDRGIELAAALGCFSRSSKPDLRLLDGIESNWLANAKELVNAEKIELDLASDMHGLFVEARVTDSENNFAIATISGSHENLIYLEKNGEILISSDNTEQEQTDLILKKRKALAECSFSEIFENIGNLSSSTRKKLLAGIDMNLEVAKAGMGKDGFLGIGNIYGQLIEDGWLGNDILTKAKTLTAAAVDARMSGCSLPVMTSAGSGNQGLTITLPLHELARHLKASDQKLAEALAIAHGITSILKHHTGTLSAMCGCVVCSGIGLTAGATYLLGGNLETMTAAVNNMVGSITGVICDGAKVGCAIKLVCAVDSAFQSALTAKKGLRLPTTNGVLGDRLETSLANIGLIAAPGMLETDDQILAIMMGRPIKKQ